MIITNESIIFSGSEEEKKYIDDIFIVLSQYIKSLGAYTDNNKEVLMILANICNVKLSTDNTRLIEYIPNNSSVKEQQLITIAKEYGLINRKMENVSNDPNTIDEEENTISNELRNKGVLLLVAALELLPNTITTELKIKESIPKEIRTDVIVLPKQRISQIKPFIPTEPELELSTGDLMLREEYMNLYPELKNQ